MLIDEARRLLADVESCSTGEEPVVNYKYSEDEVWKRLIAAKYFCICEREINELLKKKQQQ